MRVHRWSQFSSLSCTASVCGVLLLVSGILLAQGKGKPKVPPPLEFADALSAQTAVESVGPKLIALLDDVKRPASQRLEASLWLGKLRYMHAIPTLIKHITLIDPNAIVSGDPPDSVQDALIDFGDAAVPSIVDAIMADNEEGQHRLFCLSTAIAHKSQPAAWTYAKGLEATNPNPDKMFKSRMAYLMQFIKPQVKPESKKTTP